MRISVQLAVGYVIAIAAVLAIGILSHLYVGAVQEDADEIAEEWAEQDAIAGALAVLRRATRAPADPGALAARAEQIEALAADSLDADSHAARERRMLEELAALLRAAEADDADHDGLATRAENIALSFWKEDVGRVPRRLAAIQSRQRRLRALNLSAGLAFLVLPLLLLALVHARIGRPLARIQERVSALGGLPARPRDGQGAMARIETAVSEMAAAVEAQRRSLEQQVETRTEQLRHANRLGGLGRIAAAVAHEINTPLASIGLCVDGIREAAGEPAPDRTRIAEFLETVRKQLEACTATTQKLLTYAHLRPPVPADLPAHQLVAEAVDLVRAHFRRRRVEVECRGDAGGQSLRGDLPQLRQVLVNLLLNAADASPPGGTVTVELARADEGVSLRVRDHGPGVPAVAREQIFSPFFTTKRPGEGTGLGLSIAREIVEAHGGTVELEPGDGAGAAFRVRLPAVQGAPA